MLSEQFPSCYLAQFLSEISFQFSCLFLLLLLRCLHSLSLLQGFLPDCSWRSSQALKHPEETVHLISVGEEHDAFTGMTGGKSAFFWEDSKCPFPVAKYSREDSPSSCPVYVFAGGQPLGCFWARIPSGSVSGE